MPQILDLGKLRFNFLGAYSDIVLYEYNDVVTYGGSSYCYTNLSLMSGFVPTDPTYWTSLGSGLRWRGQWGALTDYLPNDIISDGVSSWVANIAFTSTSAIGTDKFAPSTDHTWDLLAVGGIGVPIVDNTTSYNQLSNNGVSAFWRPYSSSTDIDTTSWDVQLTFDSTDMQNITAAREFSSIYLPDNVTPLQWASHFTISNGSSQVVAVRDYLGALLVAIQPFGFATVSQKSRANYACTWGVTGRDIQPLFIKTSLVLANSNATAANNSIAATSSPFMTRVDDTRVCAVALTGAATTLTCTVFESYPDQSTLEEFITTPLQQSDPYVLTPASATVQLVATVSASVVAIFTAVDVYTLSVSGTSVASLTSSVALFTNSGRDGVVGRPGVIQLSPALFVVMRLGVAAATAPYTIVRIDPSSGAITSGVCTSTALLGVIGGLDFVRTSDTSFLSVQGIAASASSLAVTRFVINPATLAATVTTVSVDTGLYTAGLNSIQVTPDLADPNICMIIALQTSNYWRAVAVKGCVTGTLVYDASSSVQIDGARAATGLTTSYLGVTPARLALRPIATGEFQFVFQALANYVKIVTLLVDSTDQSTAITVRASALTPKPSAGTWSVLPVFTNAPDSAFLVSHAPPSSSYSGIVGYDTDATGGRRFKTFVSPASDLLSLTIRTSVMTTSDGWVLVAAAQSTAATTASNSCNIFSVYRCLPGGAIRYYMQISLPINGGAGTSCNPHLNEVGRINLLHTATEYDSTLAIASKRATCIEFAKNY